MYEFFEHTADLGLRVRAVTLETLFCEAAECLFSAIVDDVATIQPTDIVRITIDGTDREYLLFDWLNELLRHSEAEEMLFRTFTVAFTGIGLEATATGEPLDRSRHPLSREVKAITYHELKVVPDGGGWLAEVIVDI